MSSRDETPWTYLPARASTRTARRPEDVGDVLHEPSSARCRAPCLYSIWRLSGGCRSVSDIARAWNRSIRSGVEDGLRCHFTTRRADRLDQGTAPIEETLLWLQEWRPRETSGRSRLAQQVDADQDVDSPRRNDRSISMRWMVSMSLCRLHAEAGLGEEVRQGLAMRWSAW